MAPEPCIACSGAFVRDALLSGPHSLDGLDLVAPGNKNILWCAFFLDGNAGVAKPYFAANLSAAR